MAVGIELRAVSAHFVHRVQGAIAAVHEVSLAVAPGELLTLLGPSGCGKTTTLRMIAGFQEPSAGAILFGEREVTRLEANLRNIGFVFQNYALFPHLTVFENVAYGLRVQKAPAERIRREVGEVLALVGLANYGQQAPHQLSGGEQQRVALARAIVIKPRVLLFDEPLSNLDAKLRLQMRAEIRELQQRLGITTVYVTHDQEEAMAISDRIAVMNRGRIVQVGGAEELYCAPASEFVARFIGRANLVAATVRAARAGEVDLDIAGARHTLAAAGTFAPGQAVSAVIRPEALALGSAGAEGLAATVTSRTYLGDRVDYVLQTGALSLQVARYNPPRGERFAPGAAVAVRLPREGVQLLPREEP